MSPRERRFRIHAICHNFNRHEPWTDEFTERGRRIAQQTRVCDLRQVQLFFVGTTPSEYIVHKDEVSAFVEAAKKLHFDPGVNPANGGKTARIYRIEVWEVLFHGPYWWSTPCLSGNKDSSGARILQSGGSREIPFSDPAHEVEEDD